MWKISLVILLTGCTTLTGSNRDIRTMSVVSEGCEQLDVYVNKHKLDQGTSDVKGAVKQQTTIGK